MQVIQISVWLFWESGQSENKQAASPNTSSSMCDLKTCNIQGVHLFIIKEAKKQTVEIYSIESKLYTLLICNQSVSAKDHRPHHYTTYLKTQRPITIENQSRNPVSGLRSVGEITLPWKLSFCPHVLKIFCFVSYPSFSFLIANFISGNQSDKHKQRRYSWRSMFWSFALLRKGAN